MFEKSYGESWIMEFLNIWNTTMRFHDYHKQTEVFISPRFIGFYLREDETPVRF